MEWQISRIPCPVPEALNGNVLMLWKLWSKDIWFVLLFSQNMNAMKIVIPLHFISWKKTPNDAVTPQRHSQFTPKMKANAESRLLSSLEWIDKYNECNGKTTFMEFMLRA